jgi:thymidylate kinase
MTRGKYIVIEGPEGVGKTTQIVELENRLRAAGLPFNRPVNPPTNPGPPLSDEYQD